MFKKILLIIVMVSLLASCGNGIPVGRNTDNVEKYPFLCPGYLYTIHHAPGAQPPYGCADKYQWRIGKKIEMTLSVVGDNFVVVIDASDVVAITHVSGSVVEYE